MLEVLDRAKSTATRLVHHKVYHVTHDWAGLASIMVTFFDAHGVGQVVIGLAVILALADIFCGEPVKLE